MKKIIFCCIVLAASSCDPVMPAVKPGEMKRMPYTQLLAVGTDSTIVMIDLSTGKTTSIIYRFK